MTQNIVQARIATRSALDENETVQEFALFNPDGTPFEWDDVVDPDVTPTGGEIVYTPITCDTDVGTAAKTVHPDEPDANTLVAIKFTNGNSAAAPTVAFNDTGAARAILRAGAAPTATEATIAANGIEFFLFDGTNLHMVSSVEQTAGKDLPFAAVTTGTVIGTAAKTTTSPEPSANTIVPVIFTNGNSAETPTLAFNGGAARAMKLGGTASPAAKITVAAGGVVLFWFDGTVLNQIGVVS